MSFFISSAMADTAPAAAAASNPGSLMQTVIIFLPVIIIFYFMIIRPQNKRIKEQRELLASLSKGDEVITTGGLLGKLVRVADDYVVIETAEGHEAKFQKSAVTTVLPKGTLKNI